ncbi:hypothetical protein Tco_1014018 [Tanacetum coccineum]
MPQDVPSTSDRRLIKLENQVQCFMEAHLAPNQPIQVNKIASSCEICSGPRESQYLEYLKQAFVDYVSSRSNEVIGKPFANNQGPRNFNEATNAWNDNPNFNWEGTQTFESPQKGSFSTYSSNTPYGPLDYQTNLERVLNDFDSHQEKWLSILGTQFKQQQDDVINKINTLWKIVSERLDNIPTHGVTNDNVTHVNIVSCDHLEREQDRNSSPKRVYFVNTITIVKKEDEPREPETSKLSETGHDDSNLAKDLSDESFEPKEITNDVGLSNLGNKEGRDGIEKDNEWIKYEEPLDLVDLHDESIYESIIEEMPRCSLNYDFRIKKGDPNNLKFPCTIGHKFIPNAYINIDLPMNIMSLAYYNDIRRNGFECKGENFVGIRRDVHVFIDNMSHVMDFIILESVEANFDPSLSQVIFDEEKHGVLREFHVDDWLTI